jgi:hypothetical protein
LIEFYRFMSQNKIDPGATYAAPEPIVSASSWRSECSPAEPYPSGW